MELKTLIYKFKTKPSPADPDYVPDFAQNPGKFSGAKMCRRSLLHCPIERISLRTFLARRTTAGMTVEAAVILPLFLFFLMNLSCAVELIRLHGNLQMALWETGSKLAVYGYALEDNGVASLFTWFYIKDQLTECAGRDYLDSSPLENGSKGLSLWESEIFSSEDELDVIVTYSVEPWYGLAGFSSFRMANRYCAHIWNGYEIPDDPDQHLQELDIVYITETGEVYHEDRNCTHLKLSVREVGRAEAEMSVNQWGKSYSPCEKCKPDSISLVLYITDDGDRYHSGPDCSGLKRTVFSVPRSRAAGYRACSRCG